MKKCSILILLLLTLPSLLRSHEPLSNSINKFGCNFYKEELASSGKNELFSPYCLYNCLSLAYLGSEERTETEMKSVLQLDLPKESFADAYRNLRKNLSPLQQAKKNKNVLKHYQLNIANSAWVDSKHPLLPEYEHTLKQLLHAHVQPLSFENTNKSAGQINHWVNRHTKGKIPSLLSAEDIIKDTQLVLVSALYFKGSWLKPFSAHQTYKAPFYVNAEESTSVQMMKQTNDFRYFENEDLQLAILPFKGLNQGKSLLACFFLLPKNSLTEAEKVLSSEFFSDCIQSTKMQRVRLHIPRFTLAPRYDALNALSKLGMPSAFSRSANFSSINGNENLLINKIIHQAFFELNEDGVTAAAATSIGMGVTSIPTNPPIDFIADHPFLFGIVDLKSNVMLFLGKINDPL